jgi:hypothetical protein
MPSQCFIIKKLCPLPQLQTQFISYHGTTFCGVTMECKRSNKLHIPVLIPSLILARLPPMPAAASSILSLTGLQTFLFLPFYLPSLYHHLMGYILFLFGMLRLTYHNFCLSSILTNGTLSKKKKNNKKYMNK